MKSMSFKQVWCQFRYNVTYISRTANASVWPVTYSLTQIRLKTILQFTLYKKTWGEVVFLKVYCVSQESQKSTKVVKGGEQESSDHEVIDTYLTSLVFSSGGFNNYHFYFIFSMYTLCLYLMYFSWKGCVFSF